MLRCELVWLSSLCVQGIRVVLLSLNVIILINIWFTWFIYCSLSHTLLGCWFEFALNFLFKNVHHNKIYRLKRSGFVSLWRNVMLLRMMMVFFLFFSYLFGFARELTTKLNIRWYTIVEQTQLNGIWRRQWCPSAACPDWWLKRRRKYYWC